MVITMKQENDSDKIEIFGLRIPLYLFLALLLNLFYCGSLWAKIEQRITYLEETIKGQDITGRIRALEIESEARRAAK